MPRYDFRCPSCGAEWEHMQGMSEPPPACDICQTPSVRQCAAPAVKYGEWAYLTGTKAWNSTRKEKARED